MRVVLADVERGALEKTAGELAAEGARVIAVPTDVSKAEQVDALAKRALDAFGAVHVVCNNAGVFTAGATWEQSLGDWQWVLGVNLWGVIHGVRAFVPILLEQGVPGHVVNTASGAGLVSLPGSAPYNVSKHAVVTLSETLHHELRMRDAKVGVSVLCPGPINTNIPESARNRPAELAPGARATAVGGRLREVLRTGMDPAEVAEKVLRGIRDGRLYILTHEDIKAGVERRMKDILEDRVPRTPRGPGWEHR
jgi:NAD(P)-dependent dehydrogenase (short-subunit alcohol dehydrogenase family)